jgi:hypothetical protein
MAQRIVTGSPASCRETSLDESAGCQPESLPVAHSSPWGLRFCRDAHTVIEGYLCDEPVVVSNACRDPDNPLDAYVCDEPRMKALEDDIVRATVSVVRNLLHRLLAG